MRPRHGSFPNGMTYARIGDGPRSLLWLMESTRGLMLAMMTRVVRPFVKDGYSVWLVSGRPNMPTGHTVADMAQDYATLVGDEFGGRVDLVLGHSTGGIVGFGLAAEHPDRFGHIVIAGAGLWDERADAANLETTRLLVAGRRREAGAHAVRLLLPDIRIPGVAPLLGALFVRASLMAATAEDLLVSAEALHAFDPREVLPNIRVPVLLVAGDRDVWFTRESIEQAAQLIPDCTLKVYPDTSHFGAISSPRFFVDVRAFTGNDQRPGEVAGVADINQGGSGTRRQVSPRQPGSTARSTSGILDWQVLHPHTPGMRQLLGLPMVSWRLGLGPAVGRLGARGGHLVMLTVTGRSSGQPRHMPVTVHDVDGQTYLWCPYGGRSQWYRNVTANPIVTIQSVQGTRAMRATPVDDASTLTAIVAHLRDFDETFLRAYLTSEGIADTPQDIAANLHRLHVKRLEPADEQGPAPLKADLAWLWLVPLTLTTAAVTRRHRRRMRSAES